MRTNSRRWLRLTRASAVSFSIAAICAAGCGGKTDETAGFGGDAGVSGKGGASGSAGKGSAGGGGAGGRVITPGVIIDDVCAELAAVNCVSELGGEKECVQTLLEQRAVAAEQGCSGPFDVVLECVWTRPPACVRGTPDTSQCDPESAAFLRCTNSGGETCSTSGAGGGAPGSEFCSMDCTNYGVQCQGQAQLATCKCTFGPNAGLTFSESGRCQQGLALGQNFCRG